MGLMEKIFGDLNSKEIKKIDATVDKVEALDVDMQNLSDDQLKAKTTEFRDRYQNGEEIDAMLPEAFAVCREAAWRSLGMKHFRVQLIGGVTLHQGRISEMKTGEGKTLVATLAAYLNAIDGKGVHIVTVNDYLAKRDAQWMGRLYNFLGLTVGCVIHGVEGEERKEAYKADITYGTNNEFGFDYLRDNMVLYKENLTQRPLNFAIVDEVDSILVDEARTPLIISGKGTDSTTMYQKANSFIKSLTEEEDYLVEEKENQVSLTDAGITKCEKNFKIDNFSDPENMELNHHVIQALKANTMMKRDVDYIVKDGEIIIVDEFTGRLMFGRRYSNGLHQAIEAKERMSVRSESKTLATVTIQNYFRMYQKLSGMTGTAKTEEEEFRDIYNMDVVVIPTNKPIVRDDMQDAVFTNEKSKFKAITNKVIEANEKGQPVLVGTISIENSELISQMLNKKGVKHNVLNAKQHEKEAEIVAEAGRQGMVTIATNMAGRGTDIILGGNPDFEALKEMKKEEYTEEQINFAKGFEKSDEEEMIEAREKYELLLDKFKLERKEEQQRVKELGGLMIIGTERHESRRIDNQLRGRSGRQGDPGKTQFYISMEDDLMRLFGGERMQGLINRTNLDEDEPIEAGVLSRTIENAQKKVEGRNFGIRKYVLQYDNVMNKQREIIYEQRRMVLNGENLRDFISGMTVEIIDGIVGVVTAASKYPEEWDLEEIESGLNKICPRYEGLLNYSDEEKIDLTEAKLKADIYRDFERLYVDKENEVGVDHMREVERMLLLRVVDNRWMDHIDAMDQLKSGIGLRALGQQDPAMAYASEGFAMFDEMIADIREETVKYCFNVTISTSVKRKSVVSIGDSKKEDYTNNTIDGPKAATKESKADKQETVRRDAPKVGRNDPCPCGSGKKYKNCCGKGL